jgi:hypothetical protein
VATRTVTGRINASTTFKEEMDLRVVRTSQSGQFELVDVKSFAARDIQVIGQDGWDTVQPTNGSIYNLSTPKPHLQVSGQVVLIRELDMLSVTDNTNWILSFVARKLRPNSRDFDIVLGPISNRNCQVRFEAYNTLGIYFTKEGYGLYQGSIPLPMDTSEFHVITLMYEQNGDNPEPAKIQLYQDDRWILELYNSPSFFAQFGRLGGWFQNMFLGSIALQRVFIGKTSQPLPSIQQFLVAKELMTF